MNSTLIALSLAVLVVYGGGMHPSLPSDKLDSVAVEQHVATLDSQTHDVNVLWKQAQEKLRRTADYLR